MPVEITMPQLGESVTEGQIVRWLKAPGDRVARFEPIVEVLTDKVTVEVPSPAEGVLVAIRVGEGETVPVGTVLALLEVEAVGAGQAAPGEATPATVRPTAGASSGAPGEPPGGPPGEPALARPAQAAAPVPAHAATGDHAPAAARGDASTLDDGPALDDSRARGDGGAGERGLYSPAVRRLAREYGLDLSQVKGSGEGGRITRDDVLRAAQQLQRGGAPEMAPASLATPVASSAAPGAAPRAATAGAATPAPAPAGAAASAGQPAGAAEYVELTPSPVRAVIARRMAESWTTIPHAWTMVEADVTALVALREQVQETFLRREGFELTFLPFAIRAVAEALREFPELNGCWVDGRIRQYRRIHIGVAVGLEEGLLVPVVRDADHLSVVGIARAVHELVRRARAGKLSPDELQGATFTVNNTGALGSVLSGPIISPSQGAVLTTEAVTRRLVVLKDDQMAIRAIMNLCLSFDHRICDGVHALRFLHAVRRRLEAFGPGTPLS